ncbi:MAG: sulfurtransferase [Deltaproteobacteria bacterium]|nr:sulfurtransferase [Deltaproteobacteria bacterium]
MTLVILTSLGPLTGCFTSIDESVDMAAYESSGDWIIDAPHALELQRAGALVLDARDAAHEAYGRQHVRGSQPAYWGTFSADQHPHRGLLLEDEALLEERLRALGVRNDTPIVVAGDPAEGWGEDGRLVWMLRALGHESTRLVDGGLPALIRAGADTISGEANPVTPGDFTISHDATLSIDASHLAALVAAGEHLRGGSRVVDTREPLEYAGKTPYGEARGGHVPGAIHLHYVELLNTLGYLKPRRELLALLKTRGLSTSQQVVAYCTGGIRSGWFVVVLRDLGFSLARNYPGSMWEWASFPAESHPLEH